MKKLNKIMVCVSNNDSERRRMIQRLTVDIGLATIPSDAAKLIKTSPHDYDLTRAYIVVAETYNFRESPITTQRLYEMAARGMAVIIGVKQLQKEFEFICEAFYP